MGNSFSDRLARAQRLLAVLEAKAEKTAAEQSQAERLSLLLRRIERERVGKGPYPDDDVSPAEMQRRVAMRIVLDDELKKALQTIQA